VLIMKYGTRIVYTEEQKVVMWDRWKKGDSIRSIARLFDKPTSPIFRILSKTGGIRPPGRTRSGNVLTLAEREEISRGIVANQSVRSIADLLNR